MNCLLPKEIPGIVSQANERKANLGIFEMLLLGGLAGAYIAFAAEGSTMAAHDIDSVGFGRFISGVVFTTGLMLVIICGAELFTGNTLMLQGVYEQRFDFRRMLRNWFWVYTGNFLGSALLAVLMDWSGLWSVNQSLHGAYALKLAVGKANLTFLEAFARGILCNWLVCLAVWMAYAATDISGKIWGIFFPIMLFITSAFEHSVANMYYLTAGLLAKNHPAIVAASKLGDKVDTLTFATMVNNLATVTLGNIFGGGLFVSTIYWYCFRR